MRKSVLGVVLLLMSACQGRAGSEPVPVARSSFVVEVERTERGWATKCDTGCPYSEASFTCRVECNAVVDEFGVRTLQAESPTRLPTFAFVVERTRDSVHARSLRGTDWRSLSWGCGPPTATCRVAIDARGLR